MESPSPRTLEEFNRYGKGPLFGYLDMVFTNVEEDEVIAEILLQQHHSGWHGTLHAGTLFALADSCVGYGCVKSLPQDASGFTTIETKKLFCYDAFRRDPLCCLASAQRSHHAGMGRSGVQH